MKPLTDIKPQSANPHAVWLDHERAIMHSLGLIEALDDLLVDQGTHDGVPPILDALRGHMEQSMCLAQTLYQSKA